MYIYVNINIYTTCHLLHSQPEEEKDKPENNRKEKKKKRKKKKKMPPAISCVLSPRGLAVSTLSDHRPTQGLRVSFVGAPAPMCT